MSRIILNKQNTPPGSVCILRLSAIGDVCNVLPVVRTMQKHWPKTRISWLVGRLEHRLVRDVGGVEFFVFDKSEGLKSLWRLRRQLSGRRFDVLLQMQASLRASMVALQIPASVRLGFHRQQAKDCQWLFSHAQTEFNAKPHVVDGFFAFLKAMGLASRELTWDLPIPETAAQEIAGVIPRSWKRFMVVSPCTSARFRNWRNWRVDRYARIVDYAASQYGVHTVLTGGMSSLEQQYGEQIVSLTKSDPLNLIGRTGLKALLAVIRGAVAMVSPDSGPVHLANALAVPVIGLYAGSNPRRTGPYSYQQWVVNAYPEAVHQAFGKSEDEIAWGRRVRQADVLDLITVKMVKEKMDRLFEQLD